FCVKQVCEALRVNLLSSDQEESLYAAVGLNLRLKAKQQKDLTTSIYNVSSETLIVLNTSFLIGFIPKCFMAFANEIFYNDKNSNKTAANNYQICKLYEILYSACNGNVLMPLSFSESLLTHMLTGSKLAVTVVQKSNPSGSYLTISRWHKKHCQKTIVVPSGDIECAFDKNQIISKTYNINDKKSLLSISTTVIHAIVKDELDIQSKEYDLSKWCSNKKIFISCASMINSIDELKNSNDPLMVSILNKCPLMKSCLKTFIEHMIEVVSKQTDSIHKSDYIDSVIQEKQRFEKKKICVMCKMEYKKQKQKCPTCKVPLVENLSKKLIRPTNPAKTIISTKLKHTFEQIPSLHPKGKRVVKLGNPYILNPGSFENILIILRDLQEKCLQSTADSNQLRKWTTITVDASPYCLAWKLFINNYTCLLCDYKSLEFDDLVTHYTTTHRNSKTSNNRFMYLTNLRTI
ncbi:unnamed protein product, partial [Didymodactylos carnosus]